MTKCKDLVVWQIGFQRMLVAYNISLTLPEEEKFGLGDQIRRAAVSIPPNISGGCSRSSNIEFKRYLEIATSSPFELETQLLAIKELKLIKDDMIYPFKELDKLQRKLNALISAINIRTTSR